MPKYPNSSIIKLKNFYWCFDTTPYQPVSLSWKTRYHSNLYKFKAICDSPNIIYVEIEKLQDGFPGISLSLSKDTSKKTFVGIIKHENHAENFTFYFKEERNTIYYEFQMNKKAISFERPLNLKATKSLFQIFSIMDSLSLESTTPHQLSKEKFKINYLGRRFIREINMTYIY